MKTRQLPGWKRGTAWGIIALQLFSPLFFPFISVAQATEYADYRSMDETMAGLQALISEPRMLSHAISPAVAPQPQNNPPLPTLNIEPPQPVEPTTAEAWLAPKATQAAQLLMSEDVSRSAFAYARSLGEGVINQQLSDWMDQKGSVSASLDSKGKVSGDLLLPLLESERQLLFSQWGLRKSEARNIGNVGLGYRHLLAGGMLGINAFYDYDYSGKNARLGIGGEAWADYLKLSANAYYGLTGWHASTLKGMKEYDERPANGIDVRLDGWLPAHPQWGAKLKYEHYFGKGIALTPASGPGDLQRNPSAITLGLNYTPFPLLTLSGERTFGDSQDTRLDMALNYRFGVPLWRQISADNVDLHRSLIGSKYALVDRNYDIVMQYRKQPLVVLSLPKQLTAEAGTTLTIPVTISKAKYGLERIEWSASANFAANGGSWQQPALTALHVQVPAYRATRSEAASVAQEYVLTAVGVDKNGNRATPATTTLRVMRASETVAPIALTPTAPQLADNQQAFTLTASVVKEGQPVAGQRVTFHIAQLADSKGKPAATLFNDQGQDNTSLSAVSDSQGLATVKLKSRVAGEGVVSATLRNGNSSSARVMFIADTATATLSAFDIMTDNALADGKQANAVRATVTDRYGNPLANYAVGFAADNGATLIGGNAVLTDARGQATLLLTHTRAVATQITATVNGQALTQTVNFSVDRQSARFIESRVAQDALANGQAGSVMTVRIADAFGNPVPGMAIQFIPDSPVSVLPAQALTDAQGVAQTTLTSRRAGTFNATAKLVGTPQAAQVSTRFIADSTTAQLPNENLLISPDGAIANGIAPNGVTATVVDANDNPIPGVTVNFSVSPGATLAATTAITGPDGQAQTTVVSDIAGLYTVTATVNGSTLSKATLFIADVVTAQISDANLVVESNGAVANGNAVNSLSATVTDVKGNRLSGITVDFTVSAGAVLTRTQGVSNLDGQVTTSVNSLRAGRFTVTARVAGTSASKAVDFIGDISTAALASVTLEGSTTDKIANGTDSFTFHARVKDVNNNPVSGATVQWLQDKGVAATINSLSVTNDEGIAAALLESTTTDVVNVQVSASLNNEASIDADKTVSFHPQQVNLRGGVWGAQAVWGYSNPAPVVVPGAEIKLFHSKGDAQPVYSTQANSNGSYSLNVLSGSYYVEVTAPDYFPLQTTITVVRGTLFAQDFTLTHRLKGAVAKIVVSWNATPANLDAHLIVPPKASNPGGARQHVYYMTTHPVGAEAGLENDVRNGYGPETVSIGNFHPGAYCYSVHNSQPATGPLMTGAKVTLSLSDGRSWNWAVENASGSQRNTLWHVFRLNVDPQGSVNVETVGTTSSGPPYKFDGC
ncbi:hypothetical protein BWI95_03510 [Kosakonia cowanii JCM 10956 = DSM 18146]|uniref:Big-1 domain-containing protein n=1 Tax=Kosakonia cowanii JCM 10956 = DSM 18146 TaxID=1300165 RepID=A0A807LE81_9ENTR|nr:inverse autotransporter beta domain-containing protein [Kosakonia cowanii]APZ04198.1 hypothetical protein BWI95_03510 [Kosakonia cowanii JCM 10956 = DSM 18146]